MIDNKKLLAAFVFLLEVYLVCFLFGKIGMLRVCFW